MRTLALTALLLSVPRAHAAPLPQPAIAAVQLQAVNHARVQAHIASDRSHLTGLVDENYRFTGADGAWLDKPGFVGRRLHAPRDAAISYDDVRVRVFGEVGLVHAIMLYLEPDGTIGRTRYTDAYRWDGAKWRLVSAQLTKVADPTASALIREDAPAFTPWRGEDPTGDDEQVLRTLNTGYVQAFLDSNVAWYDAHLSPDYLVVFADGSFHDKGSLLAAAAHPVTNMKSFPVASVAIRRFGDVAVIHAENPYERTDGRKGVNRYTDIWHKQNGRWVCIAAHVTRHKLPS
jgi:hypothetical protein